MCIHELHRKLEYPLPWNRATDSLTVVQWGTTVHISLFLGFFGAVVLERATSTAASSIVTSRTEPAPDFSGWQAG